MSNKNVANNSSPLVFGAGVAVGAIAAGLTYLFTKNEPERPHVPPRAPEPPQVPPRCLSPANSVSSSHSSGTCSWDECSICFGDIITLPCTHSFDVKCLGDWITTCRQETNPVSCPNCRRIIRDHHSNRVMEVYNDNSQS